MHDEINAGFAKKMREAAETRVAAQADTAGPFNEALDVKRLLHELQVHQIELEMQNEELRQVIVERDEMEDLLGTYRDLYEFAPAGYFNLDPVGSIHAVNLTGAGILGVERNLLLNKCLDVFISTETRPLFHNFLKKVFAGDAKETCEVVFVRQDHAPLFVQIEAVASAAGNVCRAVVIDITSRKSAEELLRKSEERYCKTLQSLSAHIAVIDHSGAIIYVNDAWTAFARDNDAAGAAKISVGASYIEVCRSEAAVEPDADRSLAGIEAVLGGNLHHFTMEYLCHSSEQQRWFLMSVVPYGSGEGAVISHLDITDRKLAEQALQRTTEEWERTFDSVPDLIAILDNQHRIVRVNQPMANQLNLEPSECVGLPCYKVIHGANLPPSFCPHNRSLADLEEHESLVEETVFGGSFLVSTTPLFNSDGDVYASVHVARDITRLTQTEKELRDKEERLQFHLDNSPMAVIEWDSDFTVRSWTGESERLFGWSAAEALGKSFADLKMVVEEDAPIVADAMARLTDGVTRHVVITNRNYTKKSDIRHCTWYNSVLTDQQGKMSSMLSKVIDITERITAEKELLNARNELEERVRERTQSLETAVEILQIEIEERKRAEAALEKTAHEIEDLYNLAPCGYHSLDKDGTFVRINDTELQWLGYDRDEVVGRIKAADIMTPVSRAEFARIFTAFKVGGILSDMRLFFLRKDGSVLPVLLNAVPVFDSNGDYLMNRSTIYDITDLVRAEASVHRLNLLYRTLSETGKAIASQFDRGKLFQEICRIAVEFGNFRMAWVGLLDGASGEIRPVAAFGVGKNYLDIVRISTKMEPEGMGPTGRAVREGSYYICNNFRNDACTGPWHEEAERHGFRSSASLSIRLHGESIGAITIYAAEADYFDDQMVELLVQMQTDLCFALDNLNREKRRRAVEKSLQAETLQRLKAVEALRRQELVLIQQSRHAAMGEMIGNIAHQWRQPLNTLGLFTQRLGLFYGSADFNKEFLDTSVAKSLEIIQYMSHTIDDFRSFFSTDREKTEFSIDGAVTKALSLVEAGFRERMIRVEREGAEDVRIFGYPNEYAQVLLNIFMNARDVIIERNVQSPLVRIDIATANGTSLLTISDNAGGIPEDIMNKIFDPYFTTKGPQQGTGVGLFMSKTIIENNMGGRLTVRNTDEGAEFRIEV